MADLLNEFQNQFSTAIKIGKLILSGLTFLYNLIPYQLIIQVLDRQSLLFQDLPDFRENEHLIGQEIGLYNIFSKPEHEPNEHLKCINSIKSFKLFEIKLNISHLMVHILLQLINLLNFELHILDILISLIINSKDTHNHILELWLRIHAANSLQSLAQES